MPELLVYGVVRSASVPQVSTSGVEGAAVTAVEAGGLAALVSVVEAVPVQASRASLGAYRDVLGEAAARTTVAPTRFGTVIGHHELREQLLVGRADELSGLLDRLDGKVELGVKAVYDEELLLREVVASSQEVAALRKRTRSVTPDAGYYDRIRLGELVAAGVERARERDAERVLAALRPRAVDVSVGERLVERIAFAGAFLVERAAVPGFEAALEQLAAELAPRLVLRCVGPLPPYSFSELRAPEGVAA